MLHRIINVLGFRLFVEILIRYVSISLLEDINEKTSSLHFFVFTSNIFY